MTKAKDDQGVPTVTGNGTGRTRDVPLLPILSVNFVGTLGFSIVLPFLVFLVTQWGGNALIYGFIGATYSLFQLIGAPILGRWSDAHGRRKILLLSQAGTFVSWLIFLAAFALPAEPLLSVSTGVTGTFALTLPLIVVFVARAADGLTGGNVSVATAYLSDVSNDRTRNANFGKLAVSGNLGFILGPALAGLLGATALGNIAPVIGAAAISLIAAILIVIYLPESNRHAMEEDPTQEGVPRVFGQEHKPCYKMEGASLSWRQIVALPGVGAFLAIYFLVMLGFNFFYVAFPTYAASGLEWSVADTGIFFAVLGGLMAFVQGPVLSRASARYRESALMLWGSLVLAASFLFFASSMRVAIYGGALLLAVGNGLMWPSIVSLLSERAGSRYQGAVQGFAGSAGAVASILGLLIGGLLFDVIGPRVFWLSTLLILVVFGMGLRACRTRSPECLAS